jgi:hypothetical protein
MAPDFGFIFLPALITIRRTKPDPPPSVPVAFSVCLPLADVSLDGIMTARRARHARILACMPAARSAPPAAAAAPSPRSLLY